MLEVQPEQRVVRMAVQRGPGGRAVPGEKPRAHELELLHVGQAPLGVAQGEQP